MRKDSDLLRFYEEAKNIMLSLGYDSVRLECTVKLNNRLRRVLGRCFYNEKLIEIQGEYFCHATDEAIMNTLLHELAHLINIHNDRHGYYWQQIAKHITDNTKYKITTHSEDYKLEYRKNLAGYETFKCVDCGKEFSVKMTKKKTIDNLELNYHCGKCKGRLKHIK